MRRSTIRKGLTQKEMAERFNISVKTVKKYTSEPREQYEQTATKPGAEMATGSRQKGLFVSRSRCPVSPLCCLRYA